MYQSLEMMPRQAPFRTRHHFGLAYTKAQWLHSESVLEKQKTTGKALGMDDDAKLGVTGALRSGVVSSEGG